MMKWLRRVRPAFNPWRRLRPLLQKHALVLSIGGHSAVAGSCAVTIATQPLSWSTVVQSGVMAWCIGAILMLLLMERAKKQNDWTGELLARYQKDIDKLVELHIENVAMRHYFEVNNIEFTVARDGQTINVTALHKGPPDDTDDTNATDDVPGEDRTVH